MKNVIVTTSWDDGHKLDVRLAALLQKYDIKATFYISPKDHEFPESSRLSDEEIKTLSKTFEIGAHTMTHPRLNGVTDAVARKEIGESKEYLERLTGTPVSTFCYPGGFYEQRTVRTVRDLGFTYARTVKRFSFRMKNHSPFEARTSVNTYNHYSDLLKIARFTKCNPLKTYRCFHWDILAKAMFDKVMAEGGEYHLWGHSWEVDGHGDWEKLESVLKYISRKPGVQYVTNGELAAGQPKRILIATPYFPPHTGGAEFYSYSVGKTLQQRFGWEVVVATSGSTGFFRPKVSDYKGLRVYHMPYWAHPSNTPVNPLWYFLIRRIVKTESIDVINTHAPVPFLADVTTQAAGKTPIVATYHMGSMAKGRSKGIDTLLRVYERYVLPRTLGQAVHVISTSKTVRTDFLKPLNKHTSTITPAVDTDFFTPKHTTSKDSLLFVGSLEESNSYKGLTYLLEALPLIAKIRPETTLTVIGEGDGRDGYEALAAKLGIQNNVRFLGAQFGKALVQEFQNSTIFVLPSLIESFGMVAAEAMACGIPVVASNVGGIPNLVQDGKTGYLVPPTDSAALAEKIVYLLKHPEAAARLGASGRKRAEASFTWVSRVEEMNALFEGAMKGTI